MEYALLIGALVLSVGMAFAICGAMLDCLLSLMTTGELPFSFHWRPVLFAGALFWFWYLTPVVAESRAAMSVIRFLAQP